MANATDIVKKGVIPFQTDGAQESSATLASETTFYPRALLGRTTGGYLAKMDDSQSLILAGVVSEKHGKQTLPAGTAGDGTIQIDYQKPRFIGLAISGVAVTDIGKTVYASDDQTGVLTPASLTYANVVGQLVGVLASGIGLVELAYDGVAGNKRLGAARVMAATGTQSLTKWDCGKHILLPNTAAHTLNLPAIAGCPAGAEITFAKTTSDAQAVTLDGDGSETIDGATTLATIDAQHDTVAIKSTGSAWIVQNRDIT